MLDRPNPGMAASRAAAGMLSPLAEASEEGPFLEAGLDSLGRYPAWIANLEEMTGLSTGFNMRGKVKVAQTESGRARLRALADRMSARQLPFSWLTPAEVVPLVGTPIETPHPALFLERDYFLDPRRLMAVLDVAADRLGVERLVGSGWPMQSLVEAEGRVVGIRCEDGTFLSAPRVVLAAGAWTSALLPLRFTGRPIPTIRPVLGQAIHLDTPGLGLRTAVESEEVYLVPRGPHRILAGATLEDRGFAIVHTDEARTQLRDRATQLVPAARGATVSEHWSGLRPGTRDALPVIGTMPSIEGLTLASGHFRNGLLLAPWTGAAVARLIVGGEGPEIPASFHPIRPLSLDSGGHPDAP